MINLKNVKKFFILLQIIFSNLILTGCWDRQEVNDLALVTAAGIDKKGDGKIELSILVFIPKGKSSQQGMEGSSVSESQTLVRSAVGNNIADAMSLLQEKLPRHIFWGHCEVFIFNEELARDGIGSHIDFIIRHPQLRERTQLFVSKVSTKKILNLIPPLERDLSQVLRELGTFKIGMEEDAKEFSQMIINESGASGVPWIKILRSEEEEDPKQSIAYVKGTAVFKADKMVGKIDDSVTRGVLWLRNDIRLATISVKPKVEGGGNVSMSFLKAKSKLIPKIEDGKWKIKLKTVAETDIIQNSTNLDIANPEVVKPLEKQIAKQIEKRVKVALDQVQKGMNADIFGFAEAFHRKYPKEMKKNMGRWDEIFPTIEVTFDSKVTVRRQGMSSVLSNSK